MNKEIAQKYLSKFKELKFTMAPYGDELWFFGESPEKDYMAHVILEDDEYLDNSVWDGRVRIWLS